MNSRSVSHPFNYRFSIFQAVRVPFCVVFDMTLMYECLGKRRKKNVNNIRADIISIFDEKLDSIPGDIA
jgi:uncharacterized membrane protein